MEFEKSFFSAFKYLCVKFLELLDQPILFVFIKYYIYKRLKKRVPTCTGLLLLNLWEDINKSQCLCLILQWLI